jgi:hypothetical protein
VFFQSSAPTLSQINLLEPMLAALSARPAAALLTTPTVHLFTAGPSPISPTQVPSDFTEATFIGYAAVVLASLLGPIITPSNTCEGVFNNANFIAGAIVGSQTILGYWVDNGSTEFYLGEYFPSPALIVSPGDFVDLAVIIGMPFIPQY